MFPTPPAIHTSPRRPQREGEHAPMFASRKRTSQPRRSFRRPPPSLSAFAPKGEEIPLSFAPRERTSQPRRSFRRPPPSLSAPPQRGGGTPPLPRHGKEPASRAAASAARRRPSPHSLPKGRRYPSLSRHGKEPASHAAASAARRRPSPRRPKGEGARPLFRATGKNQPAAPQLPPPAAVPLRADGN